MIEVFINETKGRTGYSVGQFIEEFENICNEHRKTHRALAFAMILCDFENPQVIKVLRDQDYWDALDQISGSLLTVFSFNVPYEESFQKGIRIRSFLSEYFGAEILGKMPLVLFFQVNGEQISAPCIVAVKATSVEAVFNELRSIFHEAVASVSQVLPEYSGNSEEILNLIVNATKQYKEVQIFNALQPLLAPIKAILCKLAGF